MLVNSEVHKRIEQLSTYIETLSDNVSKCNYAAVKLIIRDNKKKVNNTVLSEYTIRTQMIDSLTNTNVKLREELAKLE